MADPFKSSRLTWVFGLNWLLQEVRAKLQCLGLAAYATAQKDAFRRTSEVDHVFETLKKTMTSLPIFTLPTFSKEFVIETDASSLGLGAVLMQEERPIAFYS